MGRYSQPDLKMARSICMHSSVVIKGRKALSCEFSPVPSFQSILLLCLHIFLLTNVKNYRLYTLRPLPRLLSLLQTAAVLTIQLPLIKPIHSLVFYILSLITEDMFRPCLAFPRSCSMTCLRYSLPTKSYTKKDTKVLDFIGGILPHCNKDNREDYCITIMTLFKLQHTGNDLKTSDLLQNNAFLDYKFA